MAGAAAGGPREPGVLYSEQTDLAGLVALALPEFKEVEPARRPVLLDAVCALNPWVQRQAVRSGGEKVDGVRQKTTESFSYQVPSGQPVLVPDLKWLAERAGRRNGTETGAKMGAEK